MNSSNNVTYSKPKVGGAVFTAPVGTPLPKDSTTELNEAFKCVGYISEDGVKNENSPETEKIKAWGGDTVLIVQTSKEDKFTYTMIEALNINVLKEVYGASNVSGTLEGGLTVKANAEPLPDRAVVIDTILKGGVLKRFVIPRASVSKVGEIPYADDEPVGYETTLVATPDDDGNTHYEYIKKA